MSVQAKPGHVNIRGKDYKTVALRVEELRKDHPDWSIATELVSADDSTVIFRATISNEEGRLIATGHAEEKREASQINKTSALENCETSAVGRALAFNGYGGHELASADELANALQQQSTPTSAPQNPAPPPQSPPNSAPALKDKGTAIWQRFVGMSKEEREAAFKRLSPDEKKAVRVAMIGNNRGKWDKLFDIWEKIWDDKYNEQSLAELLGYINTEVRRLPLIEKQKMRQEQVEWLSKHHPIELPRLQEDILHDGFGEEVLGALSQQISGAIAEHDEIPF